MTPSRSSMKTCKPVQVRMSPGFRRAAGSTSWQVDGKKQLCRIDLCYDRDQQRLHHRVERDTLPLTICPRTISQESPLNHEVDAPLRREVPVPNVKWIQIMRVHRPLGSLRGHNAHNVGIV